MVWGKKKYLRKYYLKKISNLMETVHPQIPKIDKSPNLNKTTPRHSTVTLTGKDRASTAAGVAAEDGGDAGSQRSGQVMGTDWGP